MRRNAFGTAAVALVLNLSACGSADPQAATTTPLAPTGSETSIASLPPADPGWVQVTVTGPLNSDSICPGNRPPCLLLDAPVGPPGSIVAITGLLADGVLTVQTSSAVEQPEIGFPDHCPELTGSSDTETTLTLVSYVESIPDHYAVHYRSNRGVITLGVTDDVEIHRQAVADLELDQICVVGGFPKTLAELDAAKEAFSIVFRGWIDDGLIESAGYSSNGRSGFVEVDIPRIDRDMRAQVGELIMFNVAVDVLNGTLADYDAAVALVPPVDAETIDVEATCGAVTFSEFPPDLDQFPALTGEFETALSDLTNDPEGGLLQDWEWGIAEESEERVVLFGLPIAPDGGYGSVVFERRGADLFPTNWGGCNLAVEAVGFGPAQTELDPTRPVDPSSTEIPILVEERACANGGALNGRQVVAVVLETSSTVEIVSLVEPVAGMAGCPGNTPNPWVAKLKAPLGDRTIYDAGRIPRLELR